MKISISLAGLLLLIFISLSSVAQWEWQNPLPQGNDINDIQMLDESNIWAVGNKGSILHSINGGINWDIEINPQDYRYSSVHFTSVDTGFIAAYYSILKTENGGIDWNISYSGNIQFYDIYFINNEIGWACGTHETIMFTNDGGESWSELYYGLNKDFRNIHFIDKQIGWVGGHYLTSMVQYEWYGLILRTVDGGISWDTSLYHDSYGIHDIKFADSLNGIAVVYNTEESRPIVKQTSDGGLNWVDIHTSYNDNKLFDTYMLNKNAFWIAGYQYDDNTNQEIGNILKTINGGASWIPLADSSLTTLLTIDGIDLLHITAAGNAGHIFQSENGGQNWNKRSTGNTNLIKDVFMLNEFNGWVVGNNGMILRTTDGGITWQDCSSDSLIDFEKVHFANEQIGYITGEQYILKSTDGGENWNIIKQDTFYSYHCVHFTDASRGIVGGSHGLALKTENGGYSWSTLNTGTTHSVNDIKFIDEQKGWGIGWELIMRTTDGGQSWTIQPDSVTNDIHFYAVDFINENEGWAAAWYNYILHTSDGGATWEIQNSWKDEKQKASYGMRDISFADPNNGWAVGYIGYQPIALYTINGGIDWENFTPPNDGQLHGVHFIDENTGWIVGGNGAILKTNIGGAVGLEKLNLDSVKKVIMQLYPNPAYKELNLRIAPEITTNSHLVIYDLNGKIIYQQEVVDHNYNLSIDSWKKGIYITCLYQNGILLEQKKVIKL